MQSTPLLPNFGRPVYQLIACANALARLWGDDSTRLTAHFKACVGSMRRWSINGKNFYPYIENGKLLLIFFPLHCGKKIHQLPVSVPSAI